MTKQEAIQVVMILKASYPRAEVTQETILAYATMLADIEAEAGSAAIKRLICKSKWFPAIAEIRAEVAEAATIGMPAVELAWGEVYQAISKYGMNRAPQFSCPEVAAAVRAIGWRHICLDPNVTSTRARFTDAYRAVRDGEVQVHQLGQHTPERAKLASTGASRAVFVLPANTEDKE